MVKFAPITTSTMCPWKRRYADDHVCGLDGEEQPCTSLTPAFPETCPLLDIEDLEHPAISKVIERVINKDKDKEKKNG